MFHSAQDVHGTRFVLHPPNFVFTLPTREKSRVYLRKTVFISGFPSNATEEILREVFRRFGEIDSIRMNENSCYIRFIDQTSVDAAISFCGYQIIIDGKDDFSNNGSFHVNYVETNDSTVCENDNFSEIDDHPNLCEKDNFSETDVDPFFETDDDHYSQAASFFELETHLSIPHYTEHDAVVVANKLKQQETLHEGLKVLVSWIKNGECCEGNSHTFFSMIESINSHGCQLMNEKLEHEKKMKERKAKLSEKSDAISLGFCRIAKLFTTIMMPKVCSHFTPTQRKVLKYLKETIDEQKKRHIQEVSDDFKKAYDCDEKDQSSGSQQQNKLESNLRNVENLRNENVALQCLLEASQKKKEKKVKEVQDYIEFQDKLIGVLKTREDIFMSLGTKYGAVHGNLNPRKRKISEGTLESNNENNLHAKNPGRLDAASLDNDMANLSASTSCGFVENEVRLIGLISQLLVICPFGADIDFICTYLRNVSGTVPRHDIESLMKNNPSLFEEKSTGIGANLKKKWIFCGIKPLGATHPE